ncbi:MAG: YdcF family protein [Frankiaceae bacterium]|nr:YdcF family protein [Frankiaceae bacterium]
MFVAFRLARRALAGLVLVIVLVVGATAFQVWRVARHDDRPKSDAIVVLGASQFNGKPSTVFRARLQHAKQLYDAGVAPRVITLGGGAPGDRTTEAEAGALFLQERGVDTLALGKGRNTLQSLEALRVEFLKQGWKTAVLVTDPWHELRARRMASDLGIRAATSPTRTGPAVRDRATEFRYIWRETAAYLYYRVFGESSEAGPHAV